MFFQLIQQEEDISKINNLLCLLFLYNAPSLSFVTSKPNGLKEYGRLALFLKIISSESPTSTLIAGPKIPRCLFSCFNGLGILNVPSVYSLKIAFTNFPPTAASLVKYLSSDLKKSYDTRLLITTNVERNVERKWAE